MSIQNRRTPARLLALLATMLMVASLFAPVASAQDPEPDPAPEADGRYRQNGDAGGFYNIMPPGQDGVLNGPELLAAQGGVLPPYYNDQTALYENLVYEGGLPVDGTNGEPFLGITDGDIQRFFKDGHFGTDEPAIVEDVSVCGDDVVAFRDEEFGVPHIYSGDRAQAQCANGYLTSADRLFLMDLLRHIGYARMSEFLGASEANQAMDRGQLLVAPYDEEDYAAQEQAICGSSDPEFQQVCADGQAYIEGVNHYVAAAEQNPALLPGEYVALQILPEEFILQDIIGIASLVGGIFGKGGGNEAANSMFLAALEEQHPPATARAIFDDLKAANDPDASHTIDTPFPYNVHDAIDPSTTVLLEPGSFVGTFDSSGGNPITDALGGGFAGADALGGFAETGAPVGWPEATEASSTTLGVVDGPFGPIDLRVPLGMSNAILATAEVSDTGVPIAVFGPQTGYFTPQLLVEMDIHAPGLDSRGVAFAGTNIYVQLGRGTDYAWSATSASADLVDEWALEICDPSGGEVTIDSAGYVWDGSCNELPILEHMQVAKPTAGGIPSGPDLVLIYEIGRVPELGNAPVVGRAMTTDGTPVMIAEQRTTLGSELKSALGFKRINDPTFMTDGAESFNRAFDGVDYTFNWFYIDDEDIAYRHTCLCPIRDTDTDPDLLTWGGRGHEWTGQFLRPDQQPQEINPESGFFANWNNKQAPQFRSQDDSWKHHSTDRREHLAVRMEAAVAAGVPLTRGDMVNIAEDAGTVDTNPQEIFPLALEIMGSTPPAGVSGPEGVDLAAMRAELAAWVGSGGHRRDVDIDGIYDHAVAVSIGDAWVRPLIEGVLDDEVPLELWPEGTEDHPRQGAGSAYNSGRMRFLPEDFSQVLDRLLIQPRNFTYCADGTVEACSTVLWEALAEAAELLVSLPEGADEGPAACDAGFPGTYQFGSTAMEDWVYTADCDNIIQGAAGVVAAPPMRWVNRPTFQQVVQVGVTSGRIDGADRIATGVALSRHAFGDGVETVVIASAGTFADAVAGTPLAAANDAPLLLTGPGQLSPATQHEVLRLGATRALVLGGPAAVPQIAVSRLEALGLTVERIAGTNRFETAAAIADRLGQTERFVVAAGGAFADALAAGPFAAADDRAILLTDGDALPEATATALAAATDVVIAGGSAAVPDSIAGEVAGTGAAVRRIAGPTRYSTGAAFAREAVAAGASDNPIYVVTGEQFPDALTAGAVAANSGGSLLLVQPEDLVNSPEARDLIAAGGFDVWIVGGQAALSSALRAQLEALI